MRLINNDAILIINRVKVPHDLAYLFHKFQFVLTEQRL